MVIKRVILPLALFIYIAIETYLKLHQSSLCDQTGCKLAGELLRFKPIYLNYLGLFATSILILTGWLSKKSHLADRLFWITLMGALAFEATMIGYQYFANPALCLFCLGVFSGLLLITLFNAPKKILFAIVPIVAIFTALSTLSIAKNQSFITKDGNYLIYSATCPHCQKVKKFLASEDINYTPLPITEPSTQKAIKYLGISKIPIWIQKHGVNRVIFVGDKAIITHLKTKPKDTAQETSQKDENPASTQSVFNLNTDTGCSASVIEEVKCKDE